VRTLKFSYGEQLINFTCQNNLEKHGTVQDQFYFRAHKMKSPNIIYSKFNTVLPHPFLMTDLKIKNQQAKM
jgi:hypothetical protein